MMFDHNRKSLSSHASRPPALFVTQGHAPDAGGAELFSLAYEVGFRPFAAPWFNISNHRGGTFINGGYEVLHNQVKRHITAWESISPHLIVHRLSVSAQAEGLLENLRRANPGAVISYHPEIAYINSRWGAELCLRAGDAQGISVLRPETFLFPNEISTRLEKLSRQNRLAFKPPDDSGGHGVMVADEGQYAEAARASLDGSEARFVVQPLVENELVIEGRKYELSLYAFLKNFRPLSFSLCPEAIVRAVPPLRNMDSTHDPFSMIPTFGNGAQPSNDSASEMTLAQFTRSLAAVGFQTEGLWERVERMAARLFQCFAQWPPLMADPDAHRLFLLTRLDVMLVNGADGIEPLFVGSHAVPSLRHSAHVMQETKLLRSVRLWLTELLEKCLSPQAILLPVPDFESAWKQIDEMALMLDAQPGKAAVLENAAPVLNHIAGRQQLLAAVRTRVNGNRQPLYPRDEGLRGLRMEINGNGDGPVLDLVIEPDAELGALVHPLASVFPTVGLDYCVVDTRPWPDARFEYLHPGLVGPSAKRAKAKTARAKATAREESLLQYLGRVITSDPQPDPLGKRFVEPGVGRTALVDFLRVAARPDLKDFSVLGVGLTPYSAHGYAMVGPYVDGLTSINRAVHRQRCAERLAEAGCRVAETVAIIRLPGLETTMPDETKAPAALIVRGFRCVLRVKQLDPLASLFLSVQHRPHLLRFLLDPRWETNQGNEAYRRTQTDWQANAHWPQNFDVGLWQALCRFGGTTGCLRRITGNDSLAEPETYFDRQAKWRRLQVIYSYAPILLEIARSRVAEEMGRDHETEPLSEAEYLGWFAARLGAQLALMKQLRFLHDYHQQGISRYTPQWIYTLCETNVTLLAEFPDLDTGIFTDRMDAETLDELLISADEFRILADGYENFHAKDLAEATAVLRTLALIVACGDTARETWAVEQFTRSYEQSLSRRVFAGNSSEAGREQAVAPGRSSAAAATTPPDAASR